MLSKYLVDRFLLSGLLVLTQSTLPCPAADDPARGNLELPKVDTAPVDETRRKSAVRQIWAKYQRLGAAALKKNDLAMSLEMFAQAVQEAELLNFDRACLVLSLDSLSMVYEQLGKMQDSLQAEKKALEIRSRLPGHNSEAEIDSLKKIGDLYIEMGDNANAKIYLQKALSLSETISGDGLKAGNILESLLEVSTSTHDPAGQKEYVSKLLRIDEGQTADENTADHLDRYASILWQEGQLSEASKCLSRSFSIRNACQSPDDPSIIAVCRNIVRADLILGSIAEAEKDINKVLSYDRLHLTPNSPDYLFDLLSLAEIKLAHGNIEAARQLGQDVLNAQKESKDQNTLDMADACSLLGRICAAKNQWDEALSLASHAFSIRQALGLPEALSVCDYETLARAASAQGQLQEAESSWQKALDIRLQQFSSDQSALAKVKLELQTLHDQIKAKAGDEKQLSEQVQLKPEQTGVFIVRDH